jgi:mono/diheme cytochrome c family protein
MRNFKLHTKSFSLAFAFALGLFFSCPSLLAQDKKDTKQTQQTTPDGQQAPTPTPTPAPAGGLELSADDAVINSGKALFEGNCKQCHAVHSQVVGPQLSDVYKRQKLSWLVNFIKYPQKAIESDAYAQALYQKYNKQVMPNHDFLSDAQIVSILSWVQAATIDKAKDIGGGTTVASTPTDGGGKKDKGVSSGLLTAIIVGLGIMLAIVLGALFLMAATLTKYLRQAKGLSSEDMEVLEPEWRLVDMLRSRSFIGIVAFLFLGLVTKAGLEGTLAIGVQQGYAPTQPIPFSHKLHAGQYEIACQYCHTGVEKGKSANIPSANICMNCHNAIKTTSPNMQKIYDAVLKDEPIQWVRIHNLPDLAYFNHAQHVKVGGLACENCHGDIKEMEVVQQVSLLTMGWCIDCHRKTDVNKQGNAYYDKLVKLHAADSKKPLKVENIGGLECGKCHY